VRLQADDHYQLALSYRENRAYLLAEQEVRKALELTRNDPRYFELLAIIYQDQRRLQPAEEAYQFALQQPGVPPSVLVNYSTLLLLRDRPDEAITLARRVLQDSRYDKPALAYTNIGVAYLKKGVFPQAAEQFRVALDYQPHLPEAHYNLGLVYRKLGEHDKAIRAFREAIRFRPSYVDAYAGLGEVLLELGRHEEARKAFERVIALEPDSDMAVASRQHLQRFPPEKGAQHAGER
jgi:Tfp pilus assembly protein PilF